MNVAALLQDSPSEDRRRPPPPASQQQQPQHSPPAAHPNPQHDPSTSGHSLPAPRPQQAPPSPQWSRSNPTSAREHIAATRTHYSQWPPPPYIRPASAQSDSVSSKDPTPAAWSPPLQQHSRSHSHSRPLTPQSFSMQDSRTQIGPIGPGSGGGERMGAPSIIGSGSGGIMQRSRADSHGRPSSSSPSTPFHPSPRSQQALSQQIHTQTQNPHSQNRNQRPHASSIPTPTGTPLHSHASSPAMPPLRPGPPGGINEPNTMSASTNIPRDAIIRDPTSSSNTIPMPSPRAAISSGSPAVSPPNHAKGPSASGDRYAPAPTPSSISLSQASNLMERGHAHAGTTSSMVTHAQAHQPSLSGAGPSSGLGPSRSERELLRDRDILQSQRSAMDLASRDRERERVDRERERERDRRRLSNATNPNPPSVSNLVGPGTGGPPPFLLSEDKTHSHPSSSSMTSSSLSNIDPRGPLGPSPSGSNAPLPPPLSGPRRSDSTSSNTTPAGGLGISRRHSGGRDSDNDVVMRDIRDRDRDRDMREREAREREMRERNREMREREVIEMKEREREREMRDKKDRELAMRERERATASGRLGPPPLVSPTAVHPAPPGQSPYLAMEARDREREREMREREYREREKDRARERDKEQRERADLEQVRVVRQQQQQFQQQRDKERERERERERLPGPGVIGPGVIPPNAPPPSPLAISTTAASMATERLLRPGSPDAIPLKHMYDRDPREMEREREKERERKERDRDREWLERERERDRERDRIVALPSGGRRLERDPRDLRDPRDPRDIRDAFTHPLAPHPSMHPGMSGIHPQSRSASIPPRGASPGPPGVTASPLQTMPPSSSSASAGVAGAGLAPQRQFQHQFHTQFVSGLAQQQRMDGAPSGPGTASGAGSRIGSPIPGPALGPAGAAAGPGIVGPGMGMEKREREREREKDGKKPIAGGSGRSSVLGKERDGGAENRDRDRDRERERIRERDRELLRDNKGRDVYSARQPTERDREREREQRERERERERRGLPPDDAHFPPDHPYLQQRIHPPPPSSHGHLSQQQKRQEQEQREQQQQQIQFSQQFIHPPSNLQEQQRHAQYHYDAMMVDEPPLQPHQSIPHPLHPSLQLQLQQHGAGGPPHLSSSHPYHPDSRHGHPHPHLELVHGHGHRERERDRERDRDRDREMMDRTEFWMDVPPEMFEFDPSSGRPLPPGWRDQMYVQESAFVGRRDGEREVVVKERERERERDRERMDWEREREREYQQQQQLQHGHAHPGHLHPHQRERELQHQQQLQELQQRELQPHPASQILAGHGHHHLVHHHHPHAPPPQPLHLQDSINSISGAQIEIEEDLPSSSLYGSYPDVDVAEDWDEWRAEAELESKRARVRVDLGTWVYPNLPFPYFFELGGGLVAMKDREEEKERSRELEEKKAREEKEKKEREEKEQLERERQEKELKEKEERERVEREKWEKEEAEKIKRLKEAAEKMEEGEIDEEVEKEIAELQEKVKEKEKDKEVTQQTEEVKQEEVKSVDMEDKEKDKELLGKEKEKEKGINPDTSTATLTTSTNDTSTLIPSSDDLPAEPQPPQPLLDVETRTTILIPSGYIPTEKPLRPRLWGGGGFDPRPRPPLSVRSRSRRKGGSSASGKKSRPPAISKHSSGHSQLANSTTVNGAGLASSTSVGSGAPNGTSTPAKSHTAPSHRSRRPRRVYTDDSDIFLCAIHSGWLTWSGARQARAKGRDLRIEVRVLRCAGAGVNSVFAWGTGKTAASNNGPVEGGKDSPPVIVREEMIGRFVGGYGERCFNPLGKSGKVVGEDGDGDGDEEGDEEVVRMREEEMVFDDPEDDGRSLVSAAWGTGHDGSAIEIVGVEFVEKAAAHTAPGTGRRNRAQRLLEYAERRAAIIGQPAARLAGRKRRRGPGWDGWPVQPRRLPNATVLDVIHEVDDEEAEAEAEGDDPADAGLKPLRVKEEERLMDTRTLVFGMGTTGDLRVGYKYNPSLLKEILFPSSRSSSGSDGPPPRKRRRVQEPDTSEDVEMADVATPSTPENKDDAPRSVILETAKESYLLSPSVLSSPTSSGLGGSKRLYDIALILEAEVVVEEEQTGVEVIGSGEEKLLAKVVDSEFADVPMAGSEATAKEKDALVVDSPDASLPKPDERSMDPPPIASSLQPIIAADKAPVLKEEALQPPTEPTSAPGSSPPPPSRASPIHSPASTRKYPDGDFPPSSPLPTDKASLLLDDEITKPQFAVQVLQRNLSKEMFRFAYEGVCVRDSSGEGGMEAEWAIQVKNWKWAPKGAKERLL